MSKRGIVTRGQFYGPSGAWARRRYKNAKTPNRGGFLVRNFIDLGEYSVPPQKGAAYETASAQIFASWFWPGAISLSVGNYSLTVEQETLKKTSIDNAQSVSYSLTGENEALKAGRKLSVQETPYTLTGENVTELKTSITKPQSGSYTLSGQARLLKASLDVFRTGFFAVNSFPTTFDPTTGSGDITFSNGNLSVTQAASSVYVNARSFNPQSSGKFYVEFKANVLGPDTGNAGVGIGNASFPYWVGGTPNQNTYLGTEGNGIGFYSGVSGGPYLSGVQVFVWQSSFVAGDIIQMAVDLVNNEIWFNVNGGNWNNSGTANPATNTGGVSIASIGGPYYAGATLYDTNDEFTANFGATSYAFTPPSGFGNFLGGEQLTLKAGRLVKAQALPYALTGGNIGERKTSILNAQFTSFALAPQNETLKRNAVIFAQMTPFALTGESITLAIPAGAFSMSLGTGTYALTDESLTLLKTSKAGIQSIVYSLTDESLTLLKGSKLVGSSGLYTLTGETLTLTAARRIKSQAGLYSLTDEPLALLRGSRLSPTAGAYNLTGNALMAKATRFVSLQSGGYAESFANQGLVVANPSAPQFTLTMQVNLIGLDYLTKLIGEA